MNCACHPQPPVRDGFCVECGQQSAFTEDQLAKMKMCGNCDRDQCNLCDDCPAKLPHEALVELGVVVEVPLDDLYVSNYEPYRSEQFPMAVGRKVKPLEPVLHDQPQPLETPRNHARRLLRFRDKQDNALLIATIFPETIAVVDRLWREKCPQDVAGPMAVKKRTAWICAHPFMQYLTHLLRIRLLPLADTSYRQNENVMEGIAEL